MYKFGKNEALPSSLCEDVTRQLESTLMSMPLIGTKTKKCDNGIYEIEGKIGFGDNSPSCMVRVLPLTDRSVQVSILDNIYRLDYDCSQKSLVDKVMSNFSQNSNTPINSDLVQFRRNSLIRGIITDKMNSNSFIVSGYNLQDYESARIFNDSGRLGWLNSWKKAI